MRTLALAVALSLGCSDGTDLTSACPITEPVAEVTVTAYASPAWTGVDVTSRFERSVPARRAIDCETRSVGPCEVTECRGYGIDFVNGEPTCGPTTGGAVLFSRDGDAPTRVEGGARLTLDRPFRPGEALRVATTGGDVPAFALTLPLPTPTRAITPDALNTAGGLSLDAGAPLAITWSPTTSQVVAVISRNTNGSFTAECVFDGAGGRGEVPADAIPADSAHLGLWVQESARTQAGGFPAVARARWSIATGAQIIRGR